jgi:hypothetical protein
MPISLHNRGSLASAPASQQDRRSVLLVESSPAGSADYDRLAGGRGLVYGILLSTILLCGLFALAMLIWAT